MKSMFEWAFRGLYSTLLMLSYRTTREPLVLRGINLISRTKSELKKLLFFGFTVFATIENFQTLVIR